MIHTGDCLDVLPTLDAESIDAIVTDPPYGLEFMGKEWDRFQAVRTPDNTWNPAASGVDARRRHDTKTDAATMRNYQAWCEAWSRELYRVAKPGAHLLAFGGTRTYHRLACAIEDAGWEVRDCLVWAYASGFPKSLDVSKAIDKAAGAEREVVGDGANGRGAPTISALGSGLNVGFRPRPTTAPATPDAEKWQGWGTALKPAWEPIILARKPLRGTVARNVQEYGTGALNIDGCRIEGAPRTTHAEGNRVGVRNDNGTLSIGRAGFEYEGASGRWPANVILTDPIFDGDVPGVVGGGEAIGSIATRGNGSPTSWSKPGNGETVGYGDTGTYSRFFLVPKAARSDREPVLGGLPLRELMTHGEREQGPLPQQTPQGPIRRANHHPTVKPTELMRHLVRLVTPPGGTVLDPFLGSGTTALAAEAEGFAWVGIEREASYVEIAEARLNGTQRGLGLDVPAPVARRNTGGSLEEIRARGGRHAANDPAARSQKSALLSGLAGEQRAAVGGIDSDLLPGMAGTTEGDEVA